MNSPFDEEQILEAYRGLLGREPENAEVVKSLMERHSSLSSLLRDFLQSDEFLVLHENRFAGFTRGANLVGHVEVKADEATLKLLFKRTVEQWRELGEQEPFWSVLSADRFQQSTFDQYADEFWSSGKWISELLETIKQDFDFDFTNATALELGCGVGRMTRHLATQVHRVIGIDVSPGNLEIAKSVIVEQFGSKHTEQVELVLLRDFKQFDNLPKVDLFVSFIVLQHNTPPVQAEILRLMLSRLEQGGVAIFQVVVAANGYEFNAKKFLATKELMMDMHCIPLVDVVSIMTKCGIEILRIDPDDWASSFGLSMTFVGKKS